MDISKRSELILDWNNSSECENLITSYLKL